MASNTRQGMELRDYLAVFRRRKGTVFLMTLLVAGVSLAFSLAQTPVYEAKVRLLLESTQSVFEPAGGGTQVDVPTEIVRLQSLPVQQAVRDKVGVVPRVSAIQVGQTQVMQVTAEGSEPGQAANYANAYAEAYVGLRISQAIEQLEKAAKPLQDRIESLEREIRPLQDQIAGLPAGAQRDAKSLELSPKLTSLLSMQSTFKATLDRLQVDTGLRGGGVQVVAPAVAPDGPVRPNPVRNVLLGLAVGIILGTAVAFLFEHLDDSVKSKDDLESAGDVNVLGVIPAVTSWKNRAESRLVAKDEPSSPAAEAYRSLRTSIQFMGLDHKLQVLQITSPNASEGKTTTLANLAVALSQAGQTVAILSCDLRRPRIHEYFGLPNAVGFTTVLLGETSLSAALQRVPGLPRLVLLASGKLPPNPSELLSSRRTSDILVALRSQVDMILVDSPPVLPVTDAAVLAPRVDGTLLVAMAGQTTAKALIRATEVLRNVDTRLVGMVLNGATAESGYGYGYGYSYTPVEQNGNGRGKKRSDKKARVES